MEWVLGALVIVLLAAWDNGQGQTKNGARRAKNHAGAGISWAFVVLLILAIIHFL